jgi:putative acetyltransferase
MTSPTGHVLRVVEADSAPTLSQAAVLFAEYAASLDGGAHMSLHHQGFERELATLPGRYARPSGLILLAMADAHPAGCIALREITPMPGEAGRVCEMKRMYVNPAYRGLGLGRRLAERLIAEARTIGYAQMKLDTEPDFDAAVGLYRSLGFNEIPRYNDDPVACTVYFGRRL